MLVAVSVATSCDWLKSVMIRLSTALFVATLAWTKARARLGRPGRLEQLPQGSGSALE